MKKYLAAGMICCATLLSGCAGQNPPSPSEISSANYGTLPGDYKEQIKSYLSTRLKDPYSAKYDFIEPYKGYSQDGQWSSTGGAINFGWIIPVYVNAKNSFGGYTGSQKYVFMFSSGVMYDIQLNDKLGQVKPAN